MPTKHWRSITLAAVMVVALLTVGCSPRTPDTEPTIVSTVERHERTKARTVTAASVESAPDRVLLVGDSLIYGAQEELTTAFAAEGSSVEVVGGSGTGLLSAQGRWTREIIYTVNTWDPDVVIIEACCNYALFEPGWQRENGTTIEPDSPDMYATWAAEAQRALDAAEAQGADVFWVTTPPANPETNNTYAQRIKIFNTVAKNLDVIPIDWAATLAPTGTYTPSITTNQGTMTVRTEDGLHLTDNGNHLVAEATVAGLAHGVCNQGGIGW